MIYAQQSMIQGSCIDIVVYSGQSVKTSSILSLRYQRSSLARPRFRIDNQDLRSRREQQKLPWGESLDTK